jgi:hypothetical protein
MREERARHRVYSNHDKGMVMHESPAAVRVVVQGCGEGETHDCGMLTPPSLRKRCAPSRHSGDSSLSPNEPSSSLTRMSVFSGASQWRMSACTSVTTPFHAASSACSYSPCVS